MARRRSSSSGRVPPRNANPRLPPRFSDFNDAWLRQIAERQYVRFVDLTSIEDRRRWHPNRLRSIPSGPAPQGFQSRPRVIIVPEGHPLARLAPYGGRVPLRKLLHDDGRIRRRSLDDFVEAQIWDKYGGKQTVYRAGHLSRRVGFQHPWQVIICVRRKRRREVMFAIGKAGSGQKRQRRPRRNEWSEVRC